MPDCIEFIIYTSNETTREMLIARLADAGATGFEEQKECLKAFVSAGSIDSLPEQIIEETGVSYSKSVIPEQNWNSIWEAGFDPVTIGEFCSVRANFHKCNPDIQHDIIITPKMSFGTGHHATTYLMIQAMEHINLVEARVFDFGTGTGVLSVLAEKCGAKEIVAVDIDDWSIANAIENFNINECHNILISKSDKVSGDVAYNCILANINRNVILQSLKSIPQHLVKSGVVLLSGLLQGDEEVVTTEAARCGLVLDRKTEMSGWICLLMVNA